MNKTALRYLCFLFTFLTVSSAVVAENFSVKPAVYPARSQKSPRFTEEERDEQRTPVSRAVTLAEKQRVEIAYPGQGWVYIGEQSSQPGIRYEQRKLSDNATVFMFTGEKKGSYILHFSYFDVFTDDFITDAVAVTVGAAKEGQAKKLVKAPDYKDSRKNSAEMLSDDAGTSAAGSASTAEMLQPPAGGIPTPSAPAMPPISDQAAAAPQALSPAVKPAAVQKSAGTGTTADPEDLSAFAPETLLQKAQEATNAADAAAALRYLAAFFETAEENIDEALFLQGKVYELNGSTRNIRLALDSYKTLTAEYPQSVHWAAADSRIRYITAFYVNIR